MADLETEIPHAECQSPSESLDQNLSFISSFIHYPIYLSFVCFHVHSATIHRFTWKETFDKDDSNHSIITRVFTIPYRVMLAVPVDDSRDEYCLSCCRYSHIVLSKSRPSQ